jgi:lysophospholipase L1-like esterase
MPRLRSKLTLALIAVLIVPVLVLIGELGTRLFASHLDPLEVFVTSPQLRADTQGEATSGMFEFDPLLTWRLKPDLRGLWWDYTPVSTNADHLRMDRELSPKRGLRIVCLGDSVTFGYRVPAAHDRAKPAEFDAAEQPYPRLLEQMLREQFPGREIEVLPLACPGYTSGQGLAWLQRDIASLQPDIVTACFGFNDARVAGLPDRDTMPQGAQASARGFIARSQLLLHLAQNAQRKRTPLVPPPPEPRSSEAEYVAHFAEMGALCRAQHAAFVVILPVYRDPNTPGDYPEKQNEPGDPEEGIRIAAYRAALKKSCETQKTPVLEIPELTERGWPANQSLFGERIHPDAAGHRLLAERLLPLLAPLAAERLK